MGEAFVVDYIRTPVGRYGGALAGVRTDDLAAVPIKALMDRNPDVSWEDLDDVYLGATNQAGEDNRNVARMALLLAGLPISVPGATVNRLCGSGMEAIAQAARAIRTGEANLIIAGGVESMSRAPFVIPKAERAYATTAEIEGTTLGWRFTNPLMTAAGHTDSMGETAENVATEFGISRADQDAFAVRSQDRTAAAIKAGILAEEIVAVATGRGADSSVVDLDEHPRPGTDAESLGKLRPAFREGGSVTAGNSSGINDGSAGLLLASESAVEHYSLRPLARVVSVATAGVAPRLMGTGPIPATQKLMEFTGRSIAEMDVVEINEAFASQVLACARALGVAETAQHLNPNGGAIALGHPTGMSGARITGTAIQELKRRDGRFALATMCIGVGQGIAILVESVG